MNDDVRTHQDQFQADGDQALSDADEAASTNDQETADRDQRASDLDQATADRDRAARSDLTVTDERRYRASRDERETGSSERVDNRIKRAITARGRDATAHHRDRLADARDGAGRAREVGVADVTWALAEPGGSFMRQLEKLRAEAAADRAGAAKDRAQAARDRVTAARGRARLEAELQSARLEAGLHSAHLDQQTGAYRREMGRLALSNEIDRARRSDGRFVLAFVDVDGLKVVNDRDGLAAGDRVLESVVRAIRSRLRSFDPVIRYGDDEFVCGLGTDLAEAERRFDSIGIAVEADTRVSISVGLAALAPGETADQLTERADRAMLEVKDRHHSVKRTGDVRWGG
jgi:diguanylate cyclase (GGDEF)-like protein